MAISGQCRRPSKVRYPHLPTQHPPPPTHTHTQKKDKEKTQPRTKWCMSTAVWLAKVNCTLHSKTFLVMFLTELHQDDSLVLASSQTQAHRHCHYFLQVRILVIKRATITEINRNSHHKSFRAYFALHCFLELLRRSCNLQLDLEEHRGHGHSKTKI